MPTDWTLFLPVLCIQKGTKYDGEAYMERICDVIKQNGRLISKSDNMSKDDFQSGDIVTIKFQRSHFDGVVDFAREEEIKAKCTVGSRARCSVPGSVSPASSAAASLPERSPSLRGIRSFGGDTPVLDACTSGAGTATSSLTQTRKAACKSSAHTKRQGRKRPRSQSPLRSRPVPKKKRVRRQSGIYYCTS